MMDGRLPRNSKTKTKDVGDIRFMMVNVQEGACW